MTNSWFDYNVSLGSLVRLKCKKGIWLFPNFEQHAKLRESVFTCLYLGTVTDNEGHLYVKILMEQIYYIVVNDHCFSDQESEDQVQVKILA